jgi:hypothetical protein
MEPSEFLNQQFTSSHFFGDSLFMLQANAGWGNRFYSASPAVFGNYTDSFENIHWIKVVASYDSLKINSTYYHQVVQIQVLLDYNGPYQIYYWAKNIGLIRKCFYNGFISDTNWYEMNLIQFVKR